MYCYTCIQPRWELDELNTGKKCHSLHFPKILHVLPDLLEEIHGRDVFRSWDCPASPILPTQIDHDHALMIPEL